MATRWVQLSDDDLAALAAGKAPTEKLAKKFSDARKRISVASAKGKGRAFQQWACGKISALIGIPYTPGDDESLIRSREMGQAGEDVILVGEARKRFPFSVECKSTESGNLQSFIRQAAENEKKTGRPFLVLYRTKSVPIDSVVMAWETFARLFSETKK